MIRGSLTFKLDHLTFEAHNQKNKEQSDTSQFNMMIDYHDIVSVSILKIPNEEAADHPEKFVSTNYRFNYLVQIEVSAINGLSAVLSDEEYKQAPESEKGARVLPDDQSILVRSNMSLANIFFKVSVVIFTFMTKPMLSFSFNTKIIP